MNDVLNSTPSTLEVLDLLARLRSGDPGAWVMFDQKYRNFTINVAKMAGLSQEDAEDLFQNLVIKFREGITEEQLQPKTINAAGFKSWFQVVVKNAAFSVQRKRSKQNNWEPLPNELRRATTVAGLVAERFDRDTLLEAAHRHIARNRPQQLPAWRLWMEEGLTQDEIAERLQKEYDAVVRGLSRLKKDLIEIDPEFGRLWGVPPLGTE